VQPGGGASATAEAAHAADAAELLDLLLFQPAVAADRELAVDLSRTAYSGRSPVLDVAELPGGAGARDDQERGDSK